MKNIFNVSSEHIKAVKYTLTLLFFLFALGFTIFSVDQFVQYSALPIGLVKAVMGILVLSLVDDVIFHSVDTIEEIKNKNTGYALIYLGNAIIIAACIGLS